MGHIELHGGSMNRTIPVDGLMGVITIDLSGKEPSVLLPENVTVERREQSLAGQQ